MPIKTGKEKCKEIIDLLRADGIEKQASKKDIEKAIMQVAGTSDRTLRQYIKALKTLEFVFSDEKEKVFYLTKEKEE